MNNSITRSRATSAYRADPRERLALQLAAVLWRFLEATSAAWRWQQTSTHSRSSRRVPSGDRDRDKRHPLRRIVSELVGPTRDRYERLLRRTDIDR